MDLKNGSKIWERENHFSRDVHNVTNGEKRDKWIEKTKARITVAEDR